MHCLAGISRSVTVTVAYLMYRRHLTLNDAYDVVKKCKPNISPNFNFMGQLLDFERTLNSIQCKCAEGATRENSPDHPNNRIMGLHGAELRQCKCKREAKTFFSSPTCTSSSVSSTSSMSSSSSLAMSSASSNTAFDYDIPSTPSWDCHLSADQRGTPPAEQWPSGECRGELHLAAACLVCLVFWWWRLVAVVVLLVSRCCWCCCCCCCCYCCSDDEVAIAAVLPWLLYSRWLSFGRYDASSIFVYCSIKSKHLLFVFIWHHWLGEHWPQSAMLASLSDWMPPAPPSYWARQGKGQVRVAPIYRKSKYKKHKPTNDISLCVCDCINIMCTLYWRQC